jgi:hypothetical protein
MSKKTSLNRSLDNRLLKSSASEISLIGARCIKDLLNGLRILGLFLA